MSETPDCRVTPEPGKWYRTRDGEKVFVVSEVPINIETAVCCDFVGIDPEGYPSSWSHDGRYSPHGDECHHDIIGLWVDEPTDEEIAEAVRNCPSSGLQIATKDTATHRVRSYKSPREFVDAINEYRSENDG